MISFWGVVSIYLPVGKHHHFSEFWVQPTILYILQWQIIFQTEGCSIYQKTEQMPSWVGEKCWVDLVWHAETRGYKGCLTEELSAPGF